MSTEYVEFLLKNYHRVKRNLEQMELELEHHHGKYTVSAREKHDGAVYNAQADCADCNETTKTNTVAAVCHEITRRTRLVDKDELLHQISSLRLELKKLDCALESLESRLKKVLTDIYIRRLTWDQVCARNYISANTLNRYRKRGIAEIAMSFYAGVTLDNGGSGCDRIDSAGGCVVFNSLPDSHTLGYLGERNRSING